MTYTTPELTLIGSATGVVLGSVPGILDNFVGGAYDLDHPNKRSLAEW